MTFPLSEKNKPRTAVCLSGHLRTFRDTYRSFNRNIIEPTKADVFIHTWETINSKDPTWWSEVGDGKSYHEITENCLDEIKNYYKPKKITIEESKDFYDDKYLKINRESFCKLENIYSMMYSIKKSNELRKEYQSENNLEYDVVVRCRTDLEFQNKISFEDFKGGLFYTPPYLSHRQYYNVVCDIFCYGSPDVMDTYANLIDNFDEYFMTRKAILYNNKIVPEYALRNFLRDKKIKTRETFIYFHIKRMNGDTFSPILKKSSAS